MTARIGTLLARILRRPRIVVPGLVVALATGAIAVAVLATDDESRTETTGTTTTCTGLDSSTTSDTTTTTDTTTTSPTSTTTTSTTTSTTTTTSPPPAGPSVVLRTLPTSDRVVALTFDAGSDTGAAAQILDILRDRGVKASFGLTGCWVDQNPSLARRIVAEGHAVINHTQDHLSFTGYSTGTDPLPFDVRAVQVQEAEQGIISASGENPQPWFRPPYGDYDDGVLADVGRLGYRYTVMWSLDSLGWKGLPADQVAARVIDGLVPGGIILMHVGAASTDVAALPTILDALAARDLRSVTLDQYGG